MLPLLLSLQVESGEAAQVLLADSLVHSGASPDSLTVVVSRVSPPISFGFHVAENHILNWSGKAWDLGRNK